MAISERRTFLPLFPWCWNYKRGVITPWSLVPFIFLLKTASLFLGTLYMYKIDYDQIQPPFHTPTAPLSFIYPQHMTPSHKDESSHAHNPLTARRKRLKIMIQPIFMPWMKKTLKCLMNLSLYMTNLNPKILEKPYVNGMYYVLYGILQSILADFPSNRNSAQTPTSHRYLIIFSFMHTS